jgi:hypothetical protein
MAANNRISLHARVEPALYQAIREEAAREERSISSMVVRMLRTHLAEPPKERVRG